MQAEHLHTANLALFPQNFQSLLFLLSYLVHTVSIRLVGPGDIT